MPVAWGGKAKHSLGKAKHSLGKAKHGLGKTKHGLGKAKHAFGKTKHGFGKTKHGLPEGIPLGRESKTCSSRRYPSKESFPMPRASLWGRDALSKGLLWRGMGSLGLTRLGSSHFRNNFLSFFYCHFMGTILRSVVQGFIF